MKIAFIVSMKYGLTQFIYRDIEALVSKGHEVRIFTLHNEKGLYNPRPDWTVIPVNRGQAALKQLLFLIRRPAKYLRLLKSAWQTKSLVDLAAAVSFVDEMADIDVMYAYFGDHKLFTGAYCKQIAGIPLLVTIRAYELYRNPNPQLFRQSLAACDRILTITNYNKNILVEEYGVPAENIDIVRQIVDLEKFKYQLKIKILIVAFFAEKKGHEILFQAIKQMDRDDIEVWVAGDLNESVLRKDVRQLAQEIGIESQIAFFGAQSGVALRALYRECDVFCLPSRKDRKGDHEGFPNVIMEAMAFGKPVVSTIHAGIPEALDSILVEENNVEQLTEALHHACDSAQLRQRLGDRNRRAAEQLFSPANNDKLESILAKYARHPKAEGRHFTLHGEHG